MLIRSGSAPILKDCMVRYRDIRVRVRARSTLMFPSCFSN